MRDSSLEVYGIEEFRFGVLGLSIGALIIRIGCWGPPITIIRNPQDSIGDSLGPYSI